MYLQQFIFSFFACSCLLFISLLVCLPVFHCIKMSYSLSSWLFYCRFSFLLFSSGRSFIVLNDSYNNFLSLWLLSLPFDSADCFPFFSHLFFCLIIHLPSSLCNNFSFHLFSLPVPLLSFSLLFPFLKLLPSSVFSPPSGALCLIQTDHLSLEELHTTRLSCMPATEECWGQEEPAV